MKRTSVINKSIIKILNKEFYLTVLRSLLEAVRNERPQRHYDNMPNTRQYRFKSFLRRQTLRGFHSHPEAMISLQPTFSLFPKLKEIELKPSMKITVAAKRNSGSSEMEWWGKCKRRRNRIQSEGYYCDYP